jgi:hypothetical protein
MNNYRSPNKRLLKELQYSKISATSNVLHNKVVYGKRSSIRDRVNLRNMIDAENDYVLRCINKKISKNQSDYR